MHSTLMKLIPNKAGLIAGRLTLELSKQSPHILFGAGVVGFGATVYLASKAALTLDDRIDELKENLETVKELRNLSDDTYTDLDFRKDLTYVYIHNSFAVVKLYAPTLVVGLVTVACLTKSHSILTNRNTALVAAYSALDKSYQAYRRHVVEEFGEEKDFEFRHPTEEYKAISLDENGKSVEIVKRRAKMGTPSPYAKFFDESCKEWQRNAEYNYYFLRCQQNWANDMLIFKGHLFLNEVYDQLGMERTQAGNMVGWVAGKDGDNFVDFGIYNGDNPGARDFVNGREGSILLDFNVDGVILGDLENVT